MTTSSTDGKAKVLLRLKDVKARTKLSRSTIYNKLDATGPHYDPEFPRQIKNWPRSSGLVGVRD